MSLQDVIDQLADIAPGSRLDSIRAGRGQARENAQNSYLALLAPTDPGPFGLKERFAVATFVAGLHRRPRVKDFYSTQLIRHADVEVGTLIDTEAAAALTQGPYGSYPAGLLGAEDRPGLQYRVAPETRVTLGPQLAAALEHAHLLVFHPRDARSSALQALLDAGLSTTEIVTLSQLVAFLSFQIRVIEGLSALAADPTDAGGDAR